MLETLGRRLLGLAWFRWEMLGSGYCGMVSAKKVWLNVVLLGLSQQFEGVVSL